MCGKRFIDSNACLFSQLRAQTIGSDNGDFDALAFALFLKSSCQRKGGFIDGNGQPGSFTLSYDCMSLVKIRNRLAKLECFVHIEQMMSVLEKAGDFFGGEPSAQREYEKVISKLSLNFTMRDSHFFLKRID